MIILNFNPTKINRCAAFLLGLFLIGTIGCKEQNQTTKASENPESSSDWTLIFEEEFNEDLSQWNAWNSGAFNEEIQLYQAGQLSLQEGILKIHIVRDSVMGETNIYDPSIKSFEYRSGRIESKELFGPSENAGENTYRFMARIKLPSGHGMWPAFWTYGDPWPTKGEIDILEAWGGRPQEYLTNLFYGPTEGISINTETDVLQEVGTDVTASFHLYEMIWSKNSIEIYFDQERIHTYTASDSNNIEHFFGKKHKVVLNTAVGGIFFDDRNSQNYVDNSVMEVDWVKVYKR